MAIITLTTDLGVRDHYAASLKGTLLRLAPEAMVVDVTHDISPWHTMEAAYVLGAAYHKFPEGSIHLLGVDPEGGARTSIVVMEMNGHHFIAPDNGILSLIRGEDAARCFLVTVTEVPMPDVGRGFLAQNRMTVVAARLAQGEAIEDFGEPFELRYMHWGAPAESGNALRGQIIHIDRFGNAITNIRKKTFMDMKGERSFQIFLRKIRLQRIVSAYGDVSKGSELALFADSGHLEIAIREGSAERLLGINIQDMLTIEFYG
jgi:S-adenosyl-L-methionine hydrolase (adenosine-forming)